MAVVIKLKVALQVCINFRQVKLNIFNDTYPMNRIENQLKAMAGPTVFTTLNPNKGYHQLLIHPESKHVTIFSTPNDIHQ